ncbi:hypothetical protein [Burkholderia contaminans]|uniref:hypothetical protein n=1 Tax=Burkholderia contaminans TaxID=488447 RepID=UPI0012603C2C|nr:hypothetical protein [Burkholderia contaminans]
MTYIVFAPGVALSDEVPRCVRDSILVSDERGHLVIYESYLTPTLERSLVGTGWTSDTLEDVEVQKFLDSLPDGMFFMKRVGVECRTRGRFDPISFGDEPDVEELDAAYVTSTSEVGA